MSVLRLAPHVHTSFSDDSDWAPGRLARLLHRCGFDGALVCDHDRTMDTPTWERIRAECARLCERTGFVLVPGIEYQDPDHVVHVPVFGAVPFYGRSPQIGELLRRAHADGAATVFAHPARRDAWRRFDPSWAPHLSAVEVWNRKYDGIRPNRWALRTAADHGLPAAVALDWHGPRQLYPLAVHVAVPPGSSASARADAVVAALREGTARATAFGVDAARFDRGLLGGGARTLETVRAWAAPRVRRLEHAVGMRR